MYRSQKLKQKEATIQYHFKNIILASSIARQNNSISCSKDENIYMNTKLSLINSYFNRHVQTEGVFKSVEPYREGGNYDDYSRTNSIPIDFK